MLDLVVQTLGVTAPVFALLFLGTLLKRLGLIDAAFIGTASELVFRATMPVLLFLSLLKADLDLAVQPDVLLFFCLMTLVSFGLLWGWAIWRCPREDRGVYVQGAFRSNGGIMGLALVSNLYGDYGLSLGSVLVALVILLYNSLSALILTVYSPQMRLDARVILGQIARNPLILGVVVALPFAYWQVEFPDWCIASAEYFAHMTLPLALICIGGSLSLDALRRCGLLAISASLMKMVWLPLLAILAGRLFGLQGANLGVLFVFFACPTAAASFVMARAAGANAELAAAIIVLTTLVSVVSINVGILLLQWLGWA